MTGRIDPIVASVSYQEIMKRKTNDVMRKMRDLTNMDTFVLRPS